MITPEEYQERTAATATYRHGIDKAFLHVDYLDLWLGLAYCTGKLNGEAGEVAELVFKALRDDGGVITDERKDKLFAELGDCQWYIARICAELGFNLADVMEYNLAKLSDRQHRGVLGGDGDSR